MEELNQGIAFSGEEWENMDEKRIAAIQGKNTGLVFIHSDSSEKNGEDMNRKFRNQF